MRTQTLVFLLLSLLPLSAAPFAQSGPADTLVNVYGTVFDGQGVTSPVYLAKVMFIAQGDTITTYSYCGQYSIRLPRSIKVEVADEAASAPRKFVLHQNYPNPFNPSTVISYQLSTAAEVDLTVYSITGQTVRTLDSGHKSGGGHSVVWDGCDDRGQGVGAGVYLYRLRTGRYTETRKMLLLDGGGIAGTTRGPSSRPALTEARASDAVSYEIVALREGFDPHRETGFLLPASGDQMKKDIYLTRRFVPGEYFPLGLGNRWEYLSAPAGYDRIFADLPDSLISERETEVKEIRALDGKEYALFSNWPVFAPEVFHNETVPPLFRISEEGKLTLRYRDVEIPLYSCSKEETFTEFDLGELFRNSPADSARFRGIRLEIYRETEARDQPCTTPAGTYHDCRQVQISTRGKTAVDYTIFFSRTAGPVCCFRDSDRGREYTFLKRAVLDKRHCGVLDGVCAGDTVTDTDLREILRLALDPSRFPMHIQGGYPYSDGAAIVGSGDARVLSLIPTLPCITYAPFETGRIEEIVRSGVLFSYLSLDGHSDMNGVRIKNGKVYIPVGVEFANNGKVGYSIGNQYEYTRKHGMWVGKEFGSWIAESFEGW